MQKIVFVQPLSTHTELCKLGRKPPVVKAVWPFVASTAYMRTGIKIITHHKMFCWMLLVCVWGHAMMGEVVVVAAIVSMRMLAAV